MRTRNTFALPLVSLLLTACAHDARPAAPRATCAGAMALDAPDPSALRLPVRRCLRASMVRRAALLGLAFLLSACGAAGTIPAPEGSGGAITGAGGHVPSYTTHDGGGGAAPDGGDTCTIGDACDGGRCAYDPATGLPSCCAACVGPDGFCWPLDAQTPMVCGGGGADCQPCPDKCAGGPCTCIDGTCHPIKGGP